DHKAIPGFPNGIVTGVPGGPGQNPGAQIPKTNANSQGRGLLGKHHPSSPGATSNPFQGESNAQVRQKEAQASDDVAKFQSALDTARKDHLPPAIQNSLQQQRDAAAQREADARLELANRAAANTAPNGPTNTTPSTTPKGPKTVCIDCKIIRPGGG